HRNDVAAGDVRQRLFPRRETQPPVHGRQPVPLRRLRRNAGRAHYVESPFYPSKAFAWVRASSSLPASLPPPRALSGLPPPLPPIIGAMVWIIFPAWTCLVSSGETVAMSETAPLDAPPRTTTPLNWLFKLSAMDWRKSPSAE